MSNPYPQNPNYSPQPPADAYYRTYDNQAVYLRDPEGAIQEQAYLPAAPPSTVTSWFDYSNPSYLKGLLVGVGATLLVTNPTVQNAVVKGAVGAWSAVVGGIEEVKERVRDARAEKSTT